MHIKAKLAVQYVREHEGDFDFSQVTQAQLERLEKDLILKNHYSTCKEMLRESIRL